MSELEEHYKLLLKQKTERIIELEEKIESWKREYYDLLDMYEKDTGENNEDNT
jgi:hypothetical protein